MVSDSHLDLLPGKGLGHPLCGGRRLLSERAVSQRKQKPVLLVSARSLQREMRRGAARQQSVGAQRNVGGGDGRVRVCPGSTLNA